MSALVTRGVLLAVLGVVLSALVAPLSAEAAKSTKSVKYGPFTIPGGDPGRIEQLRFRVQRPCQDCYITSFKPDLVYPDGASATMEDDGVMLHHMVLSSQFRPDATCSSTWLGLAGERLFASGDERTRIVFPHGYGYRVRWYDSWNMLIDLMNHTADAQTVYLRITYTYRPSSESVARLRPVWLDIDQCGDSEYSIPAGFSDTHRDWSVNVPGEVIAAIGHLHGHGVLIKANNVSIDESDPDGDVGELICLSEATLDPHDAHRVEAMSTCVGTPLATVSWGDTVRLHSQYNSSHAADDVMGIMLLYIHPQ